ncbi:ABC transporter ATP-binding protein [Oculatella sp. FACHB-28]|uniref:ABC transporter ATP-binding protein n=1 Tax=Cyanophyceae TaxID=3028117 RepID=UPI0016872D3D|nr:MULTISPECIES: ABC transporter ATP-binding protein [Cyanophyceae]MBD1869062.1 ABC transporter ATP-binding protein [Cyanobacteria bacterium FACHB-471]MBD2055502.1 ABC transporter ATP-binding protein [Oculatella sp. FACHB-28]MBD2069868.1 ABC transporter ATP-binding protein [Leptolyngbya sp. FACHB-671]
MSSHKLLLKFAKRHPGWIIISIALGFSGALFNGISTILIVPILLNFLGLNLPEEELTGGGSPGLVEGLLAPFNNLPEESRIYAMTGAILLTLLLKNLASYLSTLSNGHLSRLLTNSLRREGLRILLEVNLDFYAQMRIGDLINRIGQEINRTAQSIKISINILTIVLTILVFIGLLIRISWQLTLASTGLLLLVGLANQFSIVRAKFFGKALAQNSRDYSNALLDVLTGIRLIKATSNEEQEYQRVEHLILERERAEFKSQANNAAVPPINEMSGIVAVLSIVLLSRVFFAEQVGSFSVYTMSTYLFVLFRLMPIIGQLNGARNSYANAIASVDLVDDFLRRDNKNFIINGVIPYSHLVKGISFENVSFKYPEHENLVLNGINLWIPKGTTLALVGASGAGKSTVADLLPRFYDTVEGSIKIDGTDIRDYDVRTLRRAMGIVSQDTFLFNDSVRNNIAYARSNVTEDEIIEAAKRANAYEFILRLPQGLDTQLGDRGVLLSGGQRQRLAIARALLQNPEILILDEATSALDSVSERLVQEAIDDLSRDRTTLVIAHRLSTVRKADQIAVMEKGQVVELGNHEELMQTSGYYARLCAMQFAEKSQMSGLSDRKAIAKTSYEIRTRLNTMIGSLRLLVDGMLDTPEEETELTEEAYYSALNLLKSLESFETGIQSPEELEVAR